MFTQLAEFLAAHASIVIPAATVLAALAILQWRKVRIAELELRFKEEMLKQGMSAAELAAALSAKAPARRGLLDQFGSLSGGAKAGVVFAFIVTVTVTSSMLFAAVQAVVFWGRAGQPPRAPEAALPWQPPRVALAPERPEIVLPESGRGTCRVYLTDGYAAHDLRMLAVIQSQDNPQSELRVAVTPGSLPRSDGDARQRSCEVQIEAIRGKGRFTVQVTAADAYRQQAQTSFVVHVGDPAGKF